MSYGLYSNCYACAKLEEGCTDRKDIEAAISTIHSKDCQSGHKGWGTIALQCGNLSPKQNPIVVATTTNSLVVDETPSTTVSANISSCEATTPDDPSCPDS